MKMSEIRYTCLGGCMLLAICVAMWLQNTCMHALITANLWISIVNKGWQNTTLRRYWLLTVVFGFLNCYLDWVKL